MARINVTLKYGLQREKHVEKGVELHDQLNAGMIISAKEKSEKLVTHWVDNQPVPVLVESPARLGALLLCEQVAMVGDLPGPMHWEDFKNLHQEDLAILNFYADMLSGAMSVEQLSKKLTELGMQASPEVTQRGRHDRPGESA